MSRPPRKFTDDYTLISQETVGGMAVFSDRRDIESFLSSLDRNKKKHGFHLVGYAVMPASVRLVVRPNGCDMANALQGIFTSAAKRHCARRGWRGHVFRARYHDRRIGNGRRLRETLEEVEDEPVRTGLVGEARDWPYSSRQHRLKLLPDDLLDEIDGPRRASRTRPKKTIKVFDWFRYAARRDLLDELAEGKGRNPNHLWLSMRYGPDAFTREVTTRKTKG